MPLGFSVLLNHQTVLTESLARSLRLLTHSIGEGNSSEHYFLPELNAESTKAVVDQYVDFLVYTFTTPLPDESPARHLRGFLSDGLVRNSGLFYGVVKGIQGRQIYVLRVNPGSLWSYFALNLFVLVVSFAILIFYRPETERDQPLELVLTIDDDNLKYEVMDLLMGKGDIASNGGALADFVVRIEGIRLNVYKLPE